MMIREPAKVPAEAGVFALVNKKRRHVYVAYTVNLQKRSHSLSHMLLAYDDDPKGAYWALAGLPKNRSDEFTFRVILTKLSPDKADAVIKETEKALSKGGYKVVSGSRPAAPLVVYEGKKVSLPDALKLSKSKVKYSTAYRRIQRGWTVEQALGLAEAPPRWDHSKRPAKKSKVKKKEKK